MRIFTISPSVPDPSTGGGGNWQACFLRYFAAQGHDVTHMAVVGKHASVKVDLRTAEERFKASGMTLLNLPFPSAPLPTRPLSTKIYSALFPTLEDQWPREMSLRDKVVETIDALKPDVVLPFSFDAVLYTHKLRSAPRVGCLAEGPHLNTYVNWKYNPVMEPSLSPAYLAYTAREALLYRIREKLYAEACADLTIATMIGHHYVRWGRDHGVNAHFVTTPSPDPIGPRWESDRASRPPSKFPRILMIGHLHSTSNRSQLPIFFKEFMPAIEKLWPDMPYEIRMVGKTEEMPARYDRWRSHPKLRWTGPVSDPTEEFLSCDILLVPVPAPTGPRVRILNGWSYGCCVVAHDANRLGLSELENGKNALIGKNGSEMAKLVVKAWEDPALRRRLGAEGRKVFETNYNLDEGGRQYMRLIEQGIALFKEKRN